METIKKQFPTLAEFKSALSGVKTAYSQRSNTKYTITEVTETEIIGTRDNENQNDFRINIEELFEAHKQKEINTTVLKNFISTRAQSPALAILKSLGVI